MRTKMLAITVISVIAGTLALYVGSQFIIVSSFAKLEEQKVQESIEITRSALSNEFADLSSKARDYADWDDTYVFVQDGNEEYIQNNLDAPTWANLRVDVAVFINTAGQVVFGIVFQPDGTTIPIPQSLLNLLSANDTLWGHPSITGEITGIVPLEDPLLIASKPIMTSMHEGPIRGALIMGRYLDSEEIEYLSQTVHLPLSLSSFIQTSMQHANPCRRKTPFLCNH
jgi:sensor domain CHASE-containing protein